jgi:hypothetical protein
MTGRGDHSDLWAYIEGLREQIRALEDALSVATGRIAALEHGEQRIWDHIANMPGGI